MSQVQISCPHCGYSKATARAKIPTGTKQVKCPHCQQAFALAEAIKPAVDQSKGSSATPVPSEPTTEQPAPPVSHSPPASGATRAEGNRPINFEFHGTAKEYFGIWIVNTLLKIVTLGIYSPWAKVRKRSYFYGCTRLEGMNFDYLADPIALLKGWLLGAALFLLYSFGTNFSPLLSALIALLIFVLMPWVIVRSRLFNSRNSAHRNIRFNFYPDYRGAYFAYFWLALLTPLTAGLLSPYMIFRQKQFLVENSSFGKTPFKFFATGKDYYLLCLRGLGIVLLVGVGGFAILNLIGPLLHGVGATASATAPLLAAIFPLLFLLGYLFVALYFYVRFTNLTWNNTRIGRHRFNSELKLLEMAWLFFSNGIAILASFGLLTPWATIRLARYRLQKLTVNVAGNLEEFEASNRPDVNAAGEEIGDIFGLEIGL